VFGTRIDDTKHITNVKRTICNGGASDFKTENAPEATIKKALTKLKPVPCPKYVTARIAEKVTETVQ
jgi:hypothetical protein